MTECLTKKRNYCVNEIYSQPVITTTSGVTGLSSAHDYAFTYNPVEYTDPDGRTPFLNGQESETITGNFSVSNLAFSINVLSPYNGKIQVGIQIETNENGFIPPIEQTTIISYMNGENNGTVRSFVPDYTGGEGSVAVTAGTINAYRINENTGRPYSDPLGASLQVDGINLPNGINTIDVTSISVTVRNVNTNEETSHNFNFIPPVPQEDIANWNMTNE